MDTNDSSADKNESAGGGGNSLGDEGLATNSSNSKLHFNQVPAKEVGRNDNESDDDSLDNSDDKIGIMDSKSAGILQRDQLNKTNNPSATSPLKFQKDNANNSSSQSSTTLSQNEKILSPSITDDTEDKTQSSCLSSPNASTSRSTPPTEVIVTARCSSAANTPPTDSNTPKRSPVSVQSPPPPPSGNNNNTCIQQPINVFRNGTIPNAGKPLLSTMSKKLEISAKGTRTRKLKSPVAMYESEISENKIGIKLCIKKSDNSLNAVTATPMSPEEKGINKSGTSMERNRKSSRNVKQRIQLNEDDQIDEIDYKPKRKKERNTKKQNASATVVATDEPQEVVEQSIWGSQLPENVLFKIFANIVEKNGCVPALIRLGAVCSLWRRISLFSSLWKIIDLSNSIELKYCTDLTLNWFVDNRCICCTELNAAYWKVSDINCFLLKLTVGAPNLTSINLAGWKDMTSDHLKYLVENMKKLKRLDLSAINMETICRRSAVEEPALSNAMKKMGERLTHLYLTHNHKIAVPQLVNALSSHCPNLAVLDLTSIEVVGTYNLSNAVFHIEKLQQGCTKLKVLRVSRSQITLNTASVQEMMDSPGFPDLEELSIHVIEDPRSFPVANEHIQRILKSSSKLKLLNVRGCTRLTHESLIRLPAWDINYLFLAGCSVTRDLGSRLELVASKWAHSLIELDLSWSNKQPSLDNALRALADKGAESRLAHLDLSGSSVSEDAVKEILANCPLLSSIDLSSCRGLPRGYKRKIQGPQLNELRDVLKVQLKVKLPENVTTQTAKHIYK